jgi:hypothetical protein
MVQESAAERERRWEREEREFEAMDRWRHPQPCRCPGDMPGRCPGPAYCPMCEDDAPDSEDGAREEYPDNGPTDPWKTSGGSTD